MPEREAEVVARIVYRVRKTYDMYTGDVKYSAHMEDVWAEKRWDEDEFLGRFDTVWDAVTFVHVFAQHGPGRVHRKYALEVLDAFPGDSRRRYLT